MDSILFVLGIIALVIPLYYIAHELREIRHYIWWIRDHTEDEYMVEKQKDKGGE